MNEYPIDILIGTNLNVYTKPNLDKVYIQSGHYGTATIESGDLLELIKVLKEIAEKEGLSDES